MRHSVDRRVGEGRRTRRSGRGHSSATCTSTHRRRPCPSSTILGNLPGPVQAGARHCRVVSLADAARVASRQQRRAAASMHGPRVPIIVGSSADRLLRPTTPAEAGRSGEMWSSTARRWCSTATRRSCCAAARARSRSARTARSSLKGTDLVSRSSGANKIKGATVAIN